MQKIFFIDKQYHSFLAFSVVFIFTLVLFSQGNIAHAQSSCVRCTVTVDGETGRWGYYGNGGRDHFYFRRPGYTYCPSGTCTVTSSGGGVCDRTFTFPKPSGGTQCPTNPGESGRYVEGGFIWKGRSEGGTSHCNLVVILPASMSCGRGGDSSPSPGSPGPGPGDPERDPEDGDPDSDSTGGMCNDPYGGRSQSSFYCGCSGCWRISVGGPRGGSYMYCRYHLYRQYNIFPPAWQLGRAGAWIPCMVPCITGCCVSGGGCNVRFVGTSLY